MGVIRGHLQSFEVGLQPQLLAGRLRLALSDEHLLKFEVGVTNLAEEIAELGRSEVG